MAYYLQDYTPDRCQGCGRPATVELKTSGTTSYGYWCKRCGQREVTRRNKGERK